MKTKKFFAVEVFDNTCNVTGHQSGIYGKGDYSWVTDSLNGGCDADYNMTEEEANEVKADFERIINERNLEWASVAIDSVEIPVAETMQDVADFYNESDTLGHVPCLRTVAGHPCEQHHPHRAIHQQEVLECHLVAWLNAECLALGWELGKESGVVHDPK